MSPSNPESTDKREVAILDWIFDIIKMIAANVLSKYVGKWFDQLLKKLW